MYKGIQPYLQVQATFKLLVLVSNKYPHEKNLCSLVFESIMHSKSE